MKNFTRILALVLAMALCLGMLTACGGSTSGDTASADNAAQPADDTAAHTDVVFESGTGDARLAADTTADADKYGGVMKLNFNAATNSLDPAQFHNNQNYTPGYHIYESPIQVADDGTVWASVCTYELSEDGLTLTLTVRDNVLFHNGDTVDINDVVASINRFLHFSETGMANFGNYIVNTEITDNTVVYTLSDVAPMALLTIGELKGGCKVMPAEIAEAHAEDYITADEEIVGTGPYMLETWNRDVDLTLTRFEDYVPYETEGTGPAAAKHAYFDQLYFSVAADQTARTNGMIAGDFDYSTSCLTDMAPQMVSSDCWNDMNWNGWSPTILFNLSDANADSIVNDVNFRKAVRACMDMTQLMMANKTTSAEYQIDGNPMMPSSPYYNDILVNDYYDLDAAAQYLEESAYDGQTIRWYCADSDSYYRTALPASEMLKAIGVDVDLQVVDVNTYESMYNDPTNSDFDICCRETQKSYIHPLLSQFVSSYALWECDERTALLETLGTTAAGSEESIAAYAQFCQLVEDEVPYIIVGDFGTLCWYSAKMIPDRAGVDVYWWNSYFTTAE